MSDPVVVLPDWPAPARVHAATTTRAGGVSPAPWDSLNLGMSTGDDPARVAENHRRLAAALELPTAPCWLRQVHGNRVVKLDEGAAVPARDRHPGQRSGTGTSGRDVDPPEADAAWTDRPGAVCAVLTADCLPVVLCTRSGDAVAAVHCGWRGLAAGVLTAAIRAMPGDPGNLLAWLGPAIGPEVYEVGPEVRRAFSARHEDTAQAFRPASRWNHFLCDLYAIAHLELDAAGVHDVHGGGFCTHRDAGRFYSYRRDGETGRMATVVWVE